MPRPPSRPGCAAYTRAEIQKRFRERRKEHDAQLRQDNETLRGLVAGMVPQPMVAAAAMMPAMMPAATVAEPVPVPIVPDVAQIVPVLRPAFIPTEDFRHMVASRASLDLIDAVLRTTGAGRGMSPQDIAAACKADLFPVLKLLAFLHSEKLLFDSGRDGQWRAVPGALDEWQHRLNTARSMPPMPSTTEPDLLPPGLFKIPSS